MAGLISCVRTEFTGSRSIGGGAIRSAMLYSCLVYGNVGVKVTMDSGTVLYHSTAVGNTDSVMAPGMNLSLTNSIVAGTGAISKLGDTLGSVLSGFSTVVHGENRECDYVLKDPVFADKDSGDFRVGVISPALSAAKLAEDWWKLPVSDFNSKTFRFVDSHPVAGALTMPVAMVISKVNSQAAISPSGMNFVDAGETVTFTASRGEVRPARGISVNGVELGDGVLEYSYTAKVDEFVTSPVMVEARPITDF